MRPSHLIAAVLTSAAGLAEADSSSTSCTTLTGSATWSTPPTPYNPHGTSVSTLNVTETDVSYTFTATSSPAITPSPYGTNGTSATATSSSPVTVSTNVAAAREGLGGDSSMLGLVIFFALSLCLL